MINDRFLRYCTLWLVFCVVFGIWYYIITDYNNPKIALIGCEVIVSLAFAGFLLVSDVKEIEKEIEKAAKILRVYNIDVNVNNSGNNLNYNKDYYELFKKITYFMVLAFMAGALALLIYIIWNSFIDGLKSDLILKTFISVYIAFGCVLIFGKVTLNHAAKRIEFFSGQVIDLIDLNPRTYEENGS